MPAIHLQATQGDPKAEQYVMQFRDERGIIIRNYMDDCKRRFSFACGGMVTRPHFARPICARL